MVFGEIMRRVWDVLRDWYILVLGTAILGGLLLAFQVASPDQELVATSQPTSGPSEQARPPSPATPSQPRSQPAEEPAASRPTNPVSQAPTASGNVQLRRPQTGAGSSPVAPETVPHARPAEPTQALAQPSVPPSTGQAPAQPTAHGGHVGAASAESVGAGRQAFRKCQACHSIDAGKNMIGPSLAGVFGRAAGQVSGFNYSSAMRDSGVVWDADALSAFLRAPQQVVPKTKMAFPGIANDGERANLVAFLASAGQAPAETAAPSAQAPAATASPQAPAARPAPPAATAQHSGTGAATGSSSAVVTPCAPA